MRANRGELLPGALAFCLVLILGLSVAATPAWTGEAERYFNDGVAYQKKGQFDAAIAAYKRAIRIKPDYGEAHRSLGYSYGEKGQYDLAIASFKEAIRLNPEDAEMHFYLGAAFHRKGQWDAAIASLNEANRLRPDDAWTHHGLGFAYLAAGNRERALEEYKILKELDQEMAQRLFDAIYKD